MNQLEATLVNKNRDSSAALDVTGTRVPVEVNYAVCDKTIRLRGFAEVTHELHNPTHELRNPLAPVRNAIGVLRLETGVSPTVARSRDMIDRQVTHLTRLVDDLPDVGRIMSDKVALRFASFGADMSASAKEGVQPESSENAGEVAPLRILLVDDNRDSADSLAMLLELKGHEVRIAYEGEQAVDVAPRFVPHFAVIDIAMPKMDGYATIAALREMPELVNTMYAAMTGFGQDSDRQRTRDAGFHAHLVKPVELSQFDTLLAQVQARRSARGGN